MRFRYLCCVGSLLLAVVSINELPAQTGWEAGIRLGDNVAFDVTAPLGPSPRLHGAVYLERFGLATYFDWVFRLRDAPPNLKFYAGVGPELFLEGRTDVAVAGDFGIEWAFDFPLTIGFDWRPSLRLTNDTDFHTGNWGVTARLRLGDGLFQPDR